MASNLDDDPFPVGNCSYSVISTVRVNVPLDSRDREILIQRIAVIAGLDLLFQNPHKEKFTEVIMSMTWELFHKYRQAQHVPIRGCQIFMHRTAISPVEHSKLVPFEAHAEGSCSFAVNGRPYVIDFRTALHFYTFVDSTVSDHFFTNYGDKCHLTLKPIDVFTTMFTKLYEAAPEYRSKNVLYISKLLDVYLKRFPYLYM